MDDIRAVMDAAGSDRATLCRVRGGVRALRDVRRDLSGPDRRPRRARPARTRRATPDDRGGTRTRRGGRTSDESGSVGHPRVRGGGGRVVWPDVGDDPEWFAGVRAMMRRSVSPGDALVLLSVDFETDVRDVLPDGPDADARHPADRRPRSNAIEYAPILRAADPRSGRSSSSPATPRLHVAGSGPGRWTRSNGSSRACEPRRPSSTACWRRCCSPTSSDRRERAAELGDRGVARAGRAASRDGAGACSPATAALRSTRRATGSSRRSMDRRGPCDARRRSSRRFAPWDSRSERASTRARSRRSTARSAASPSSSARAWERSPAPARCSSAPTVKDLTAGSGLTFEDAGEHELKGVPDRWRLYRVVS